MQRLRAKTRSLFLYSKLTTQLSKLKAQNWQLPTGELKPKTKSETCESHKQHIPNHFVRKSETCVKSRGEGGHD
jgi:hypothetical protein